MPWSAEFPVGTTVRVVPNEGRNTTLHSGRVCKVIWHAKNECWNYYLEVEGKKVSKRYLASDLVRTAEGGA
jgi:hypothetical protein